VLLELFPAVVEAFRDLAAPDGLALVGRAPDPVPAARLTRSRTAAAVAARVTMSIPGPATLLGVLRAPGAGQSARDYLTKGSCRSRAPRGTAASARSRPGTGRSWQPPQRAKSALRASHAKAQAPLWTLIFHGSSAANQKDGESGQLAHDVIKYFRVVYTDN
jgi:hypothetical protein